MDERESERETVRQTNKGAKTEAEKTKNERVVQGKKKIGKENKGR